MEDKDSDRFSLGFLAGLVVGTLVGVAMFGYAEHRGFQRGAIQNHIGLVIVTETNLPNGEVLYHVTRVESEAEGGGT